MERKFNKVDEEGKYEQINTSDEKMKKKLYLLWKKEGKRISKTWRGTFHFIPETIMFVFDEEMKYCKIKA